MSNHILRATVLSIAEKEGDATVSWKMLPNNTKIPHNLDGPAVIWRDGIGHWYIDGKWIRSYIEFQRYSGRSNVDIVMFKLKYGEMINGFTKS